MRRQLVFACSLLIPLFPSVTDAYSWQHNNAPSQCETLSLSVTGDDGQPPYSLLLIPYGSTPLGGGVEVRSVQTIHFNGTSKDLEFQMRYPANSQYVAVVSDQNGFASGGTSGVWTVKTSEDNSCFDSSKTVHPAWPYFYINPGGGLDSCDLTEIQWNTSNSNITGTPNFIGVIPSGDTFNISYSSAYNSTTTDGSKMTGFNWTVPVTAGTDLVLIAGDQNYTGAGGWVDYKVSPPQEPTNTACIPNMPSATGGTPAGGDPGANLSTSVGASHSSHTAAIAGGVVGGVVGLAVLTGLIVWWLRRRSSRSHGPLDLGHGSLNDHPAHFIPVPFSPPADHNNNAHNHPDSPPYSSYDQTFMHEQQQFAPTRPNKTSPSPQAAWAYPQPTVTGPATSSSSSEYRYGDATVDRSSQRLSGAQGSQTGAVSGEDYGIIRSGGPRGTSMRKLPVPPGARPVVVMQHTDSGSRFQEHTPEVVEIPPAYGNATDRYD